MSYSVGQVADLAGVTIRTLHHYDEIGLLSPGGRSAAGYRIYEESDLEAAADPVLSGTRIRPGRDRDYRRRPVHRRGRSPASPAWAAAAAHRQHISRRYYDCSYEIHWDLSEMYVSDDRFRANYDVLAPGFSEFIRDAAASTPSTPRIPRTARVR